MLHAKRLLPESAQPTEHDLYERVYVGTRSERRSRMHPVLLQKVHEGAHFRQKQAVAQGQDAQWRGRPLIGLEHNSKPSVSETMRNLPGWRLDEPRPRQGSTDQRIVVIGAKPGWNAQGSSHCAVLEAPFR